MFDSTLQSCYPLPRLELADEPNLGFKSLIESRTHGVLRMGNQGADIGRRGMSEIHHDIRMHV